MTGRGLGTRLDVAGYSCTVAFGGAVVHDTMVSLVIQVTHACVTVRAPWDELGSMYLHLCVGSEKGCRGSIAP